MSSIAEARKAQYLEEVRAWNWDKIVGHAKQNVEYDKYDDSNIGGCYLGSSISIYPSGKFYMPFACSNLEPCPHCNGLGNVTNLNGNLALHEEAKEEARVLRTALMAKYGPYFTGKWPAFQLEALAELDARRDEFSLLVTCPFCGGCGSQEAHLDEIFSEALNQVADEHGGWIGGSDGDGLDVFFYIAVDLEEDEDAE